MESVLGPPLRVWSLCPVPPTHLHVLLPQMPMVSWSQKVLEYTVGGEVTESRIAPLAMGKYWGDFLEVWL